MDHLRVQRVRHYLSLIGNVIRNWRKSCLFILKYWIRIDVREILNIDEFIRIHRWLYYIFLHSQILTKCRVDVDIFDFIRFIFDHLLNRLLECCIIDLARPGLRRHIRFCADDRLHFWESSPVFISHLIDSLFALFHSCFGWLSSFCLAIAIFGLVNVL